MKRTLYPAAILAVAGLVFSCSKLNEPKIFSDDDAFVSFTAYTYSTPEDEIIEIPVTLSSVSGLTATAAFFTTDGTAQKGIDFEIIGDGTISFDKDNRVDIISLKIKRDTNYTKDKYFYVSLETSDTSGISVGYNSTVTVVISDLEHPLNPILGEWAAHADVDYQTQGAADWTMILKKDSDDDHKVWIYDIANMDAVGWADDVTMFYGIVDSALTTITVPVVQDAEYKYTYQGEKYPVRLFGFDGKKYQESGNIIFKIERDSITGSTYMESDNGFYVELLDLDPISGVSPVVSCVKQ